ncbi:MULTISPECIES: D-Ala-D-Ala carboxypeptidase family metallohydrolase [unclassified Bacteroides]|jgi:zinc D-Ala-D-Ala carboxypeptidase|uniref:D-Ala-D-Ala carboxypeptidase family metallohydrolase n=1 Tax=unclassified Bacteroides TaxID=2646097 RepID=UPI000E92365E|nr:MULTISPECIES: D-Ala-D-Ala carboxypeptidase family metallohydrolase [unclassified Bacteroides]RGN50028.1 peptidase M15 [Bacteroides sp. OM05-12]RHR75162.1 peptidase M15 [Bacteroides sp. AF16-49]DAU20739.1 MAG TPA: peptidase [Caudoviricetes sp.]
MKYFTLDELAHSNVARTKRIDNTPNEQQKKALVALVDNVLDPLRDLFGKPVLVSSGFRSNDLNRAVGGAATSQHMKGEAADIYTGTKEGNKKLFELIRDNLPFDQLIDEKDFSWVHVSFKEIGNRKQILKL